MLAGRRIGEPQEGKYRANTTNLKKRGESQATKGERKSHREDLLDCGMVGMGWGSVNCSGYQRLGLHKALCTYRVQVTSPPVWAWWSGWKGECDLILGHIAVSDIPKWADSLIIQRPKGS